jgi:diguanylate cyclase (GGDEF)-like protein
MAQMEREQASEASAQERFLSQLRQCAAGLALPHSREDVFNEAVQLFAEFSGGSDALIIDLSRDTLDLFRSAEPGGEVKAPPTVILEESVSPILDLLRDRYMSELGIRVFNQQIVEPPEGVQEDSVGGALEEVGMTQGFILPLTVARNFGSDNVTGILLINNVPSNRFADPGHLALLRVAADLLSVTADNMDLGYALARLRPTDLVTGLASRTRLQSQLTSEIERAEYLKRSFALVHADIDNLKALNMHQGYRYGDLVIKIVAFDILAEARPIDIVSRWGGEEYLVLMPEATAQEALDFAERCRMRVSVHAITPDEYHEEVFVTLSAGVAVFPDHGDNADLLLRNVDLSLLQAKLTGRNRSVVWSPDLQG